MFIQGWESLHCFLDTASKQLECRGLVLLVFIPLAPSLGFPGGSDGKESPCKAGDLGSIPGLGRSPGEGRGYPLQYSGLENSMDCILTLLPSSPAILLPVRSSRLLKVPWSHRPPPEPHLESVLFLFSLFILKPIYLLLLLPISSFVKDYPPSLERPSNIIRFSTHP